MDVSVSISSADAAQRSTKDTMQLPLGISEDAPPS